MLAITKIAPGSSRISSPADAPSHVTTAAPAAETVNPRNSARETTKSPAAAARPAVTSGLAAFKMMALVARLQWSAR